MVSGQKARERAAAFARRYGPGVTAVLAPVGRSGTRLVLIAPSGEFGDVLCATADDARAVCAELAVPVREWDRELTSLITQTPEQRVQMGARTR